MELAKLLSSGANLSSEALEEAQRRGVIASLTDLNLMAAYGGYEQYLAAPRQHVTRSRLALQGRAMAEQEQMEEARRSSGSSSSSSSANAQTSSSRFQGQKKRPIIPG